jgi:hypothetical protein
VALNHDQAVSLARSLRRLRESTWPDRVLTQAQLAKALSTEGSRVAAATLSSWESTSSPKTPSAARISAYARFFCTERSLEGEPHLISKDRLTADELKEFQKLESQLMQLFRPQENRAQRSFQFDAGPVIVICPEAPIVERGSLADQKNPNFTRLWKYTDLDALVELYGHLRAENPSLDVFHRLGSEVVSDDLTSHVVLLGGIAWNEVTRSIQRAISQVPIRQIEVDDLATGEIFQVKTPRGEQTFYPEFEEFDGEKRLISDIGYLARLRNPFKISRTLTICNGIHSRGVLGAVRSLTDARVRDENEKYLAERFPTGEFAMLLRAPVVNNETLSPDLQNPEARLFEWAPDQDVPE